MAPDPIWLQLSTSAFATRGRDAAIEAVLRGLAVKSARSLAEGASLAAVADPMDLAVFLTNFFGVARADASCDRFRRVRDSLGVVAEVEAASEAGSGDRLGDDEMHEMRRVGLRLRSSARGTPESTLSDDLLRRVSAEEARRLLSKHPRSSSPARSGTEDTSEASLDLPSVSEAPVRGAAREPVDPDRDARLLGAAIRRMRNAGRDVTEQQLILDAYNAENSAKRLASIVPAPSSPDASVRPAEPFPPLNSAASSSGPQPPGCYQQPVAQSPWSKRKGRGKGGGKWQPDLR